MSLPPEYVPVNRRTFLVCSSNLATAAAGGFGLGIVPAALGATITYTPTWASVDQHVAAPEWFQDAKFGIYFVGPAKPLEPAWMLDSVGAPRW